MIQLSAFHELNRISCIAGRKELFRMADPLPDIYSSTSMNTTSEEKERRGGRGGERSGGSDGVRRGGE